MKNKRKIIGTAALFVIVLLLTVYGVFHGENLKELGEAFRRCQPVWLIPAVACVFLFIGGESVILRLLLRGDGVRLRLGGCFLLSSVGFFFSAVTPSAGGGQPMQIYFMRKRRIPVSVSAITLMLVTITYKLVLVAVGLGIILFARDFVRTYMGSFSFLFYLGLALTVLWVALLLLLVFRPGMAKGLVVKCLGLLEKLRLLPRKEERQARLMASMDQYAETAAYMKGHISLILWVFLITAAQRTALFAVTWFVYRAFALGGTSWLMVVVLQSVISVSVDMLPLPGGMGISEGLFLKIFAPVFGEFLLPGMVLSRGLGYYGQLLISALFTLLAVAVFGRGEKDKGEKEDREKEKGE